MNQGGQTLDFAALQNDALRLRHNINQDSYSLSRGVIQLEEASRNLASKTSHPTDLVKASTLLASRGYDPTKALRTLNAAPLTASYEANSAPWGVAESIEAEQQAAIVGILDETSKTTAQAFRTSYAAAIASDWEKMKEDVMESLGQHSGKWVQNNAASSVKIGGLYDAAKPLDVSQLAATRTTQIPQAMDMTIFPSQRLKSAMSAKQTAYAAVVKEMAIRNKQGVALPVISRMLAVSTQSDERQTQRRTQLGDTFQLVASLAGESNIRNQEFTATVLNKNYYSKDYSEGTPANTNLLTERSIHFLERQFRRAITDVVAANLSDANRGGRPGILPLVKAFVRTTNLRSHTDGTALIRVGDNMPIWAVIFYSIRCGEFSAALQCAETEGGGAITGLELDLLKSHCLANGKLLPTEIWRQAVVAYREAKAAADDPFKQAVLQLIARADPGYMANNISETSEDFLWFKLSLCLSQSSDTQDQPYTLADVQEEILSFGAAHFNPSGKTPLLYAQVLLLACLFENATETLFNSTMDVEGIHIGLALAHYGLLRTPKSDVGHEALVVQDNFGRKYLQLPRMLLRYIKEFGQSEPSIAADYIAMLPSASLVQKTLSELCVETRAYVELLGTMRADGTLKEGKLYSILPLDCIKKVMTEAAEAASLKGRHMDAIVLNDLAGNHSKVVTHICNQMSRSISTAGHDQSELKDLVFAINTRYKTLGVYAQISQSGQGDVVRALEQIITVSTAFDLLKRGFHTQGLQHIESLGLVPRSRMEVDAAVENFWKLHESLRGLLPDILVSSMRAIESRYMETKSGPVLPTTGTVIAELQEKADALVRYSGSVRYRLSTDTNKTLMRIQVLLK